MQVVNTPYHLMARKFARATGYIIMHKNTFKYVPLFAQDHCGLASRLATEQIETVRVGCDRHLPQGRLVSSNSVKQQ